MFITALFLIALQSPSIDVLAGPQFDKLVTVIQRAEHIDKALATLATASGVPLKAASVIQPEVVLLRLKEVPLREALQRLARACGGEWTQTKSGYYLGRNAHFEDDLAKREYAYNLQRFTKILGDTKHEAETQKPFTEQMAQGLARQIMAMEASLDQRDPDMIPARNFAGLEGIRHGLPSGRFLAQLVSKISPEILASVPAGERRVFATSPTTMELPLNLDLQGLADRFTTEQALWTEVAAKLVQPPPSGRYHVYQMLSSDVENTGKNLQVGRVVVTVQRLSNSQAVFISAHMLNAAGDEVARGTQSINLVDIPAPSTTPLDPKSPVLTLSKTETQLATSALAGDRGGLKQYPEFDPEVVSDAQHPDTKEPLASYVSSLLLQAADIKGLNVVADLPDNYLAILAAAVAVRAETVDVLMRQIHGSGLFMEDLARVDDKFIEIDGGTILGSRRFRADRPSLGTMLSSNPGGDPPLETTLDYIVSGGLRSYDFAYKGLRFAASAQPPPRTDQFVQYGQVLGQIRATSGGGLPLRDFEIPFSRLDKDTQNAVIRLVFFQDAFLRKRVTNATIGQNQFLSGLAVDPCEVFPNGLPPNCTVSLRLSNDIAMQAAPDPSNGFVSIDQPVLNPNMAVQLRRALQRRNSNDSPPPKFRTFKSQSAHFNISLSDTWFTSFDFQVLTPLSKKYLPLDELPQEFKDAAKPKFGN